MHHTFLILISHCFLNALTTFQEISQFVQ